MDSSGNATLVDMTKLNLCLGNSANNFTLEKFRYMTIMSGCDYLDSLPNIGLGRSFKFWSKVTNLDLKQVLPKIPAYLNMNVTVTTDYIDEFIKANHTFLYQLVFDPRTKNLQPLNKYENHIDASDLPFCGEMIDRDLALGLALGNVDLNTLRKVNNYNPDQHPIVCPVEFNLTGFQLTLQRGRQTLHLRARWCFIGAHNGLRAFDCNAWLTTVQR